MNKFIVNKWKSKAMWPHDKGLCLNNIQNITEDQHGNKRSAQITCQMLEADGFGGDGKIFPIVTWVEPIIEPVDSNS
jgi:hypothetical protein